jgi:hypothetical protein
MLAPVLSANETPAADATAARTVVATEATTATATPCFQTGCRSAVRVDALGVVRVGTWMVVDMSSSLTSADRPVRPAHTPSTNGRVRIRQVASKSSTGFAGGVDRTVRLKNPVAKFSVAGCRIGGTPFVVGWKAVIGTARN